MSKIGLVLEGGGARGAYTAGVLQWLMDHEIHFEYGVGMSISALYLFSFFTGNASLMKDACTKIALGKGMVGLPALLSEGSLVGYDKMFKKVQEHQPPLDMEAVHALPGTVETGVFDLEAEDCKWIDQQEMDDDLYYLKAASTIPGFGKKVLVKGKYYLDGGMYTMIPIERALKQGCEKLLVITTKTADYIRKPTSKLEVSFMNTIYGKYEKLNDLVVRRHLIYNAERLRLEELIEKKMAVHLFPSDSCGISRFGGKQENLERLFEVGYQDSERRKEELLAFLSE